MEGNKLGKKIQDWAASLGFTLPDGSAPPASQFALLTATPHRRQLWEALVESIQPRQKIENMRKQILVSKLQESKKYKKTNSTVKQITDRFDLWHKQNAYEAEVKEKRDSVVKCERTIMTKASDSLFEVCRLLELEKMLEEITEKSVILKLVMKRKKKIMEDFDRRLLEVKMDSGGTSAKDLECIKKRLLGTDDCKCLFGDSNKCKLLCEVQSLCNSGMSQQCLWEEVIKYKGILLDKFSAFLAEVNSSEKSLLSEKEREMEKALQLSITQLKQKTAEKSLQMIINSSKGKQLDGEIESLLESLSQEVSGVPNESTLNESFSYLISGDSNKTGGDNWEKVVKNLKNYLTLWELQKYEEFLKEEVKRVEEEMMKSRRKDEWKDSNEGEKGVQLASEAFDNLVEEINSLQSEKEELEKGVLRNYGKVEGLRSLVVEMEGKAKRKALEESAENVKISSEKQIQLLLETPIDVFRTVENSSGRIFFECESASQFLNSYGGELKQWFSAMLIPPLGNPQQILSEVSKRKTLLGETKKIISEREKLAAVQRKVQNQLSSIKEDRGLCVKNFKESDRILCNVLFKTDEFLREVDYIEKILSNWVEQPYRSMIKETVWGKNLKESEEKYGKGKNE